MKLSTKLRVGAGALAALALAAAPAWAQDAAAAAPTPDKGDTTWMLLSSVLVLMMAIPGLALFYGGLVRTKNMASVLTQVFVIVSVVAIVWVFWGYSLAFTSGNAFVGGFSKMFLSGVDATTLAGTFSNGVYIPEYTFVVFQMTFACITPALVIGAFAERARFSAVIVWVVLWVTLIYFPLAHMVWYWPGPDFLKDALTDTGLIWGWGGLDFAGGTVVHINAGVAGLVGCIIIGKRLGYPREPMPPHSLTLSMVGASLLWVGWFGFNAGSNLEATSGAALAFINTLVATAAAVLSWSAVEGMIRGKASMLGAASGAVAGLVAITPACGSVGVMGALIIGLIAGAVCLWGVTSLKRLLGADDSLDVFGVHGVGGIVGALLTGVFTAPGLGGTGGDDFSIFGQVLLQAEGVAITIVWSGVVALIAFKVVDVLVGLRVDEEAEREGLDISSHGEKAYEI